MEPAIHITAVMTRNVLSVHPETSLMDAAKLIIDNDLDGVPVLDTEGALVGILTEYDLISKAFALHLPTIQFLIKNLSVYKSDGGKFQKELSGITSLTVKDLMNTDPLFFKENTTFEEAVQTFKDHHRVNPIPVVDADHHVVGVVSRYDIIKIFSNL